MLDVNKLPRLKPDSVKKEEKTSFLERLYALFVGKRGLYVVGGLIAFLYLGLCLYGERVLRSGVYTAFKEIGSNGFGVSYTPLTSYLPFTSGLYLDDLVLTAPEEMGAWQLKAGRLSVSSFPFSNSVTVRFNGTHSLKTKSIGDTRLIIDKGEIVISKASRQAVFSVSAQMENLQAASPKSMAGLAIGDVKANMTQAGEDYKFNFVMNNAHLPAYLAEHLAPVMEYLAVQGTITGFSAVREKPLFADWTDNSGLIEFSQAEIIWKPFMAQATGTLGFDRSFRASGASVAKVYGFFDLLDRLEKAAYVSPSQVSLAKIVLGEKVTQKQGEAQQSLSAPFSIQNGKVYAGQVPLN